MSMTPLPTPPSTSDPSTFDARADALIAALPGFVTEANALETNVTTLQSTAATNASTATTQASNAAASAAAADASALTATNAPGTNATSTTSIAVGTGSKTITIQTGKSLVIGMMVMIASTATPTNYMHGQITAYNSGSGSLTVNVTTIGGSGTIASWTVSLAPLTPASLPSQGGNSGKFLTTDATTASWGAIRQAILTYASRTTNTILGFADNGLFLDITSGTFSQTFDAAATLTAGWYCYIRNTGTGDITLDPNAAELIDGLSTFVMYPGEARLIQCDGSALHSFVLSPFYRTFIASGTFTKPPGYGAFAVEAIGGGGGGKSGTSGQGGGAAGGQCVDAVIPAANVGATETVTIAAASVADANGGNTSLGTLVIAQGGSKGASGGGAGLHSSLTNFDDNSSRNLNPISTSASMANLAGLDFGLGGLYGATSIAASLGGDTGKGGGGGGAANSTANLGRAGISRRHGNGGAAVNTGTAGAGTAPGGGGGAAYNGTGGGGGRGELRIRGA